MSGLTRRGRLGGPDPDAGLWVELARLAGVEDGDVVPRAVVVGLIRRVVWLGEHYRGALDLAGQTVVALERERDDARVAAWRLREVVERFVDYEGKDIEIGCEGWPHLEAMQDAADAVPLDWRPAEAGEEET